MLPVCDQTLNIVYFIDCHFFKLKYSYSEYFIVITFVNSIFKKSLTLYEINFFVQVDKLKILIVEAINESAYGFNLSIEVKEAAAILSCE